MGRWRYRGGDDYADESPKVDKIRKRKHAHKKSLQSKEPFELAVDQWDLKSDGRFIGRVVEVHKRYMFVSPEPTLYDIDTADVNLGTIARRFLTSRKIERNLITVGDRVLCQPATDLEMPVETDLPRVMVINRAPREGKIARRDPINEALEHVIAANIDQLVIIASVLKPKVRWGLVDRYLALAEEQRLPVILVLNKVDLLHEADEAFKEKYGEMVAVYKNLGYEVLEISALSQKQQDFAPAGDLLKDKVSIFSGHSGVGKSSLVNQFDPEIVQEVEGNPDIFYKGRHTTTYASFIKLKSLGGYVIDTPGIRSLSVGDRSAIELTYSFRDLRPFMGRCKFRECRHIDEPECAVLEALDTGEVHPSRYASYRSLLLGESGREGRSGLKEEDDLQIEEFE